MGLLSWASSSSSKSDSSAPADHAPTRSNRRACWEGRDSYFTCLTTHSIIIPPGSTSGSGGTEGAGKGVLSREEDPCKGEREGYEANCAKSWVDYFNKRRVLEERQRRMLESSGPGVNGQGGVPAAREPRS